MMSIGFYRSVCYMEKNDMARFTLRVQKELLDKFGYVAAYNGRTKNKELEQMVRARINAFEQKFGEIKVEEED